MIGCYCFAKLAFLIGNAKHLGVFFVVFNLLRPHALHPIDLFHPDLLNSHCNLWKESTFHRGLSLLFFHNKEHALDSAAWLVQELTKKSDAQEFMINCMVIIC